MSAATTINVTYEELLALISNNELVPNSRYRITDYTTTTAQTNTQSAGHDFDVIVTALSTNELSKYRQKDRLYELQKRCLEDSNKRSA